MDDGVPYKKEMSSMQWKSCSLVPKQNHRWKTEMVAYRMVLY
jgi:hypothetical protein